MVTNEKKKEIKHQARQISDERLNEQEEEELGEAVKKRNKSD